MARSEADFRAVQAAFAAYIRDPQTAPRPEGVPLARMQVYRDLFFNNIASFIEIGFPVLRRLLSEAEWQVLIQLFFSTHACRTPLFVGIAEEFSDWMERRPLSAFAQRPFLPELVRHEWVELALSTLKGDCPPLDPLFEHGLEAKVLRLSSLAVIRAYAFPVHRIGPDHQPSAAPDAKTYLLAYRDREELVQFIELNAISFALLECLSQPDPEPLGQILSDLAQAIGHPDPAAVFAFGRDLVTTLHRKGVLG